MLPPTSRLTISISTYSVITAAVGRTRNSIPAGLCITVPDFQTSFLTRVGGKTMIFGQARVIKVLDLKDTVCSIGISRRLW